MRTTKILFSTLSVLLSAIILCSCSAENVTRYLIPKKVKVVESGNLAENGKLSLDWDNDKKCLLLTDKSDGYVWSSIPYENYIANKSVTAMNSALSIECYNTTDHSVTTEYSYLCLEDNLIDAQKVKNGIKLTYYFKEVQITIPVTYKIKNDCLNVTVKSDEIIESGLTKLKGISILPNLCSVTNTEEKSSYLVIPAGSGALMYVDEEVAAQERLYSGEVYGNDAARQRLDVVENETKITMPIFGVKADNHALVAIIDGEAEAARIDASAGNRRYGVSRAYATFLTRGFDEIEQVLANQYIDALALSESITPNVVYSVSYYPIKGEDANYIGMAKLYREKLEAQKLLTKSDVGQAPYEVEIIGGIQKKEFTLGIPHMSNIKLTSFAESEKIIKDLVEKTNNKPSVILSGFGKSGAQVKYIAGNYGFSSEFGKEKDRKLLENYCKNENIPIYTDFELACYTDNSKGFSTFDTAKTAILQVASNYPLLINTRSSDEESSKVRLLKRSLLDDAVERLLKFADDDISGIGLGSISNTVYSDYTDEIYYMKSNFAKQTQSLVKAIKKKNHIVVLRSAGAYVAGVADSVSDVPMDNGNYNSFDEVIPLYQAVYKGYIPLYTSPLNANVNMNNLLLRSVEFGVAPKFLITYEQDLEITSLKSNDYFYSVYFSNKDKIVDIVSKTSDFYKQISDASINKHEILNEYVTKTVFDNNITVYVNKGTVEQNVDGVVISAESFLVR